MNRLIKSTILTIVLGSTSLLGQSGYSQQTNNSSTLNNSAAPSASSITSGGTNINYQSNNSFNNENGFAPGIFCRTPSLYFGGNWGKTNQDNVDIAANLSTNENQNYSANFGVVVPFGSSVLRQCADLARQITFDRKVSTDLSLIRACSQLEKEGITVDPEKFPYLEKCVNSKISTSITNDLKRQNIPIPSAVSAPKTPKLSKS